MINEKYFLKFIFPFVMKKELNRDNSISKQEFNEFVLYFMTKITENEVKDIYNFLLGVKTKHKLPSSPLKSLKDRRNSQNSEASDDLNAPILFINHLENIFEKWFREEDSLNTLTNPRLSQMKLKDFKSKIDIWQ